MKNNYKRVKNVFLGHSLEEYKAIYDIDKTIHIDKKVIDEFNKKHPKVKKDSPLDGKLWWLIGDTYYQVDSLNPIKPTKAKKNSNTLKIALASILGGVCGLGVLGGGGYLAYRAIKGDQPQPGPTPTKKWYEFDDWYNRTESATKDDVGVLCKVKVNNLDHNVRLIGVDEDIDDNNKPIHTTWEFANLISDSNGYSLAIQWNDATTFSEKCNTNFMSSTIRYGVATDVGAKLWAQKGKTEFSITEFGGKNVLEMINDANVKGKFKSVRKKVATCPTDTFEEEEYTDKLFLASVKEMGGNDDKAIETHDTYSYYKKSDAVKIKTQIKSDDILKHEDLCNIAPSETHYYKNAAENDAGLNFVGYGQNDPAGRYWLRSPVTSTTNSAFYVNVTGEITTQPTPGVCYSVAPLFCI